jgi:hypothetical protein
MPTPLIERRIRYSGILIAAGLIIQLISFIWVQPLAFMAFIVISSPLVGIGILLFLHSLIANRPSETNVESRSGSSLA